MRRLTSFIYQNLLIYLRSAKKVIIELRATSVKLRYGLSLFKQYATNPAGKLTPIADIHIKYQMQALYHPSSSLLRFQYIHLSQ